jgi:hypothetical protein
MTARLRCLGPVPGCVVALALSLSSPLTAQVDEGAKDGSGPPWALLDAIGYGAIGCGLGVMTGWESTYSAFYGTVAAMTVAGICTGATIGNRAQKALAQGQPLATGHRRAVIAGVVMAGASLGALASVRLIQPAGEGTPLGTDQQTLALMSTAGAVVGYLYAWSNRDRLTPRRVVVFPALRESGRYALNVQMCF